MESRRSLGPSAPQNVQICRKSHVSAAFLPFSIDIQQLERRGQSVRLSRHFTAEAASSAPDCGAGGRLNRFSALKLVRSFILFGLGTIKTGIVGRRRGTEGHQTTSWAGAA